MRLSPKLYNYIIPSSEYCRDLGVCISSNLSPSKHCSNIANLAHFKCRQFCRTFACKDREFLLLLFRTYIRPILESNSQVWSPYFIRDIDKIENVQRKFTKYLPGLHNVPYPTRLEILSLDSLEVRRIRADLVLLFKIVRGLVDVDMLDLISFNSSSTRGHHLKLNVQYSRINCHKYYFIHRTIPIWNALPSAVITHDSISSFKKALININLSHYCRGCAYST